MDSIDPTPGNSSLPPEATLERRARMRYEWARARRALIGFAPLLLIAGVACALTQRSMTIVFGISAFVAGVVMLWYGRGAKRAVLPGVAAGMVPLLLAFCANYIAPMCAGPNCMQVCMAACIVGGLVAGLAIAGIGNQRGAGLGFWLGASLLSLLTGAMGCSCIGYSGVVGLAVGYAAGIVPGLLRKVL